MKARHQKGIYCDPDAVVAIVVISFSIFYFIGSLTLPTGVMHPTLIVFAFIAIFYCDHSGIRLALVNKLPKKHLLYAVFSKTRESNDKITEAYKTFTYLFLLLPEIIPDISYIFFAGAIILPVLSVYRYMRYNHSISFCGKRKDTLSPVASALIVPGFLFFLWSLPNCDHSIFYWTLLAVISVTTMILFFLFTHEYRKRKRIIFGFAFSITLFVFGALGMINREFDFSPQQLYLVTIIEKEATGGKSHQLNITVTPWGKKTEAVSLLVGTECFKAAVTGETAFVVQHKGVLDTAWYYLVLDSDLA